MIVIAVAGRIWHVNRRIFKFSEEARTKEIGFLLEIFIRTWPCNKLYDMRLPLYTSFTAIRFRTP